MKGSSSDCDPKMQKRAVFVKFGEFTRSMLLWWHPIEGYFVTRPNGLSLNGETRLSETFVEQAIAAK